MKKYLVVLFALIAVLACVLSACTQQFSVTFDAQNGTENTVVVFDSNFALPGTPTNGNKVFGGWYLDKDCTDGKEWTVPESLTGNITVYAKWTEVVVADMSEIASNYDDYSKWNFEIHFVVTVGEEIDTDDIVRYDGDYYSMTYEYGDATYTDFFDYSTGIYYSDNGDGTWEAIDENDDWYDYYVSYLDYIELTELGSLQFTENNGVFTAVNPVVAGNSILDDWGEDCTWKSLQMTVANGKIVSIHAVQVDTSEDYAGTYEFTLTFSKQGEITLEIPTSTDDDNPIENPSVNNDAELVAVLEKYADESDWNFRLIYAEYDDGSNQPYETVVLEYDGYYFSMQYELDGVTYKDYVLYNEQKEQNVYYYQNDDGSYTGYCEYDNEDEFYSLYYNTYYFDLSVLGNYQFVNNDGYYSAEDADNVCYMLMGAYDGEVYSSLRLYVENGLLTKIVATSDVDGEDGSWTAEYILELSFNGEITLSAPQNVTFAESDSDSDENAICETVFTDKNLTANEGGVAYTASQDAYGFDTSRGVQFLQNDGEVTFTSVPEFEDVSEVWLYVCTNQDAGMIVSVSVGNIVFTCDGEEEVKVAKGSEVVLVKFVGEADGVVSVILTPCAEKKSMYIQGISVVCGSTGGSGGGSTGGSDNIMPEQTYDEETFDYSTLQDKIAGDEGYSIGLPSKGTYTALVVPVQFKGAEETVISQKDLDKLNKAFNGTSEDTGWESVSSYYAKSSYGLLNLSFDIWGVNIGSAGTVYTAANSSLYYEKYSKTATDAWGDTYTQDGSEALLLEVLAYLKANGVNLADYDTNDDGAIDAVYIIYAADVDYDNADFWWAYVSWYYGEETFDDNDLAPYYYLFVGFDFMDEDADSAEGVEYAGTIDGLKINPSTFIHETGHLLGLDDYYDYNTKIGCNQGLGGADMMDATVGDHGVYSKIMLGWLKPTVITQTTTFTIDLTNKSSADDCVMLLLNSNNSYFCEYLLIDLYSASGLNELHAGQTDSYLYFGASFGARIYHVSSQMTTGYSTDYYYSDTDYNNTATKIALIKLVEADGETSKSTQNGGSWAEESDLWQTGDTLSGAFENYTRNDGSVVNFDISFDSVTATSATITVTFVTAEVAE